MARTAKPTPPAEPPPKPAQSPQAAPEQPTAPAPAPRHRPAASPSAWVVATQRLYVGAALAHLPGDLVPAQNVARNGWAGKVKPLAG